MLKNSTHPRVSVIILNWNGWADTLECLESLYQIKYPNYDVILVDNNSTDNSIQEIKNYIDSQREIESKYMKFKKQNKPIKIVEVTDEEANTITLQNYSLKVEDASDKILNLIKNHENYGFSKGNNIGIDYALNILNPDYILLLNNDTVVDPDFLLELVLTGESSDKIGFVGAKTYFYNNENLLQSAGGGKVDFKHGIVNEPASNKLDDGHYDTDVEIDYVGGACLLCKRQVIDLIGTLNEEFFMYWEDVDWCLKGLKYGFKSVYSYKSKIWHKYGASSDNNFKIYYLNRNRIYTIKEFAPKKDQIYFLIYFLLYRFWFENFDYLINRRDIKKSKCLIKGVYDGLKGP
jgi:GT2 family glycosyltransferase